MNTEHWGVVLTNLGTPETPTAGAVRRYLAEFLWDRRVVDAPRWLWWMVLHGVVLRVRPRRSAAAYRRIWTDQGSPLLHFSTRQRDGLAALLTERLGRPVPVALAMRYGEPSLRRGFEALAARGVTRVIVLPLYPQYAASTVASTFDGVAHALGTIRHLPELRFVNGYFDHPLYVQALARQIRRAWGEAAPGERLLFSFHGLPRRHVDRGDPYLGQCRASSAAVAAELGLPPDRWSIGFQSRVGREAWLRPYTDHLLRDWARAGIRSVDVICPGFSADCLETIDEIDRDARASFMALGGAAFRYIPALNDEPAHLDLLADLVLSRSRDWTGHDGTAAAAASPQSRGARAP